MNRVRVLAVLLAADRETELPTARELVRVTDESNRLPESAENDLARAMQEVEAALDALPRT